MIAKASQRANGRQLAAHLLNAHDNEQVEVAEIIGAIAQDLPGALDEWYALSRATKCKKFLYSLSVNPDPRQGPLTREQYKDFVSRVEKKLGLSGQPRAVVFHKKGNREHCHVVWSRILPDELKAIQISHDHRSLQTIIRQFAKDHSLKLPKTKDQKKAAVKNNSPKTATLHEKQQQERTGISKEERVQDITRIWQTTETGAPFVQALEEAGYHLARGESVPYVVIDRFGEIHSLPRQIEGARTRDIKDRLKAFPSGRLPAAEDVKETVQARLKEDMALSFNKKAQEPWIALRKTQDQRRASLNDKAAILKQGHRQERNALITGQKATHQILKKARLQTQFGILTPFLLKIPGLNSIIAGYNKKHDKTVLLSHRTERQSLIQQQKRDWEDLHRQGRSMARVEKRELRSLKTKLRREYLQATTKKGFDSPTLHPEKIRVKNGITNPFNTHARHQPKKKTVRDSFNQAGTIQTPKYAIEYPERKLEA